VHLRLEFVQRASGHLRVVPRTLVLLLTLVAVLGASWALITPAWQVPDEPAHFQYTQDIAEQLRIPHGTNRLGFSTAVGQGVSISGAATGTFAPALVAPNWSVDAWRTYTRSFAAAPPSGSNAGGVTPESANPPFYYVFASLGYRLDAGGTVYGQLFTVRLWDVLLLLVTTIATWLLAGEVFGRRRLPQLVAAATAGLLPMTTFISASANVDSMVIALWSLALWLGARVIRRRGRLSDAAWLSGVVAAAILTKATSYALVLPWLVAFVSALWLGASGERRATLIRLATASVCLFVPVIAWLVYAHAIGLAAVNQVGGGGSGLSITGFLSYLWEFYLPKLSFMHAWNETVPVPSYSVWLQEGLATFGWLDFGLAGWVYTVAGWLAAVISVDVVACLQRASSARRAQLFAGCTVLFLGLDHWGQRPYTATIPALAFIVALALIVVGLRRTRDRERYLLLLLLGSALLALLALLHVTDYESLASGSGILVQGRYLLPVVSVAGLCVALVVAKAPVRVRVALGGSALVALLGLQVIALATVAQVFYI
jgi:hypothetical protein